MWALLCAAGIFAIIPVARAFQQFIYKTIGREFFTYLILSLIGIGLALLLYFFIFKLKVKRVSQYIWLSVCAGIYIYFTLQLRSSPEEAVHFLEYGLLSYFLFKALNHRIKDRTIYVTALLFVLFVGTMDEFLQWMMPRRYWDFRDIGFNVLAGGTFLLAVYKGIRPKSIYGSVRKISVRILVGIMTIDLIFLGLCLSNTPGSVNRYTAIFNNLSWLQNEEPLNEFGYKYKDPEIGTFYSRLTLEKLREIDHKSGEYYGKILPKYISSETMYKKLIGVYTPYTNPFLFEFLIHLLRRDRSLDKLTGTVKIDKKIKIGNIAFRENLLIEKYFGRTLKYSGFLWSDKKARELKKTVSLSKGDYISTAGAKLITSFSLKELWVFIVIILIVIWISGEFWRRHLDI